MSDKYMFVMEKPEDCFECVLSDMLHRVKFDNEHNEVIEEIPYCRLNDKYLPFDLSKPEWCPLKKVPQKKDKGMYDEHYCDGFNDCLDEILDN